MSDKKTISINLLPFPSLLTVLFIYLKLTNQVDWSWLWVLAPTWIPFAFVATIFVGFLGVMLLGALAAGIAAVLKK